MTFLIENLKTVSETLIKLSANQDQLNTCNGIIAKLATAFQNQKKLIIFGNGGSACDAAHVAEEFTGRFRKNRKALPAIAITEPGHITCVANDFGYDAIFQRGVEAFVQEGDMVIGLSTSGNSKNVIKGIQKANDLGTTTVCFLGKEGGKLKGMATHEIIVPCQTADRIQEVHKVLLHSIIEGVERKLFPENYEE